MKTKVKSLFLMLMILQASCQDNLQGKDYTHLVNTFSGTAPTRMVSMWGVDGGTYPGAVAPSGYIQLTPETRTSPESGYYYSDKRILYFTSLGHMSGYPGGSSGRIRILPLPDTAGFQEGISAMDFEHNDESAYPGYYSVFFKNERIKAEMSASVRTGMFRFLYPAEGKKSVYIGDAGKINQISDSSLSGSLHNTIIVFNRKISSLSVHGRGIIISFSTDKTTRELLVKISASSTGLNGSMGNLKAESPDWNFDSFRKKNLLLWEKALAVADVDDENIKNMRVFYTALYHSMLLPWIISDADGSYRGKDGKIHMAHGRAQYGAFSPWDTFRSLHPLLCLINPEKQEDVVLSMLDEYHATGHLPGGPMTGFHVIPIITDTWMKGIRGFDSNIAFNAMKALLDSAASTPEFKQYLQTGFVSFDFPESVTLTTEFAYDEWAFSEFASGSGHSPVIAATPFKGSHSYRNLLDPSTLFLVPRSGNRFLSNPAYFGYKEGDKYIYSLFVPQYPDELVRMAGGHDRFSERLDSALEKGVIPFDNEPVLHIPYLFNYAGKPWLTAKHVRMIMENQFSDSPDGIPGNDDLGSLSSWYVFSALGFFPVCPGRPQYDIGSPLFRKVILHTGKGKNLIIESHRKSPGSIWVRKVAVNGKSHSKPQFSHSDISEGGKIEFFMADSTEFFSSNKAGRDYDPDSENLIIVTNSYFNTGSVIRGEKIWLHFTAENKGEFGSSVVRLFSGGRENGRKNIVLQACGKVNDSIECRFFKSGPASCSVNNLPPVEILVKKETAEIHDSVEVLSLSGPAFAGEFKDIKIRLVLRNVSDSTFLSKMPVFLDKKLITIAKLYLAPGDSESVVLDIPSGEAGFHTLSAGDRQLLFRTCSSASDAVALAVSRLSSISGDTITDSSGFDNKGLIHHGSLPGKNQNSLIRSDQENWIEFRKAPVLNALNDRITVMAWIYPEPSGRGLADIASKGDFIVFQVAGNRSLKFFAGGWGRGECIVPLPQNWFDRWHHIAGVAEGSILKIYLDGREEGSFDTSRQLSLANESAWVIGRNEEFPGTRYFSGIIDNFMVFTEALDPDAISFEMKKHAPESFIP